MIERVRQRHPVSSLERAMTNREKFLEYRKFWAWLLSCPSKKRILKDDPHYVLVEFYVAEGEEDETPWQKKSY